MLSWLTHRRALGFGASCLVHVALIAGILSAERWIMSAETLRPPVLITEVVTVSDAPSSPEPIQKKPEPRRTPSPAARLARSLAAPLQRVAEAVTPAPPVSTPPVSTPAAPEMPPPVASAAPGAGMTASTEPVAAPGPPAGAPGGAAAPSAVSAPAAVASVPRPDTGSGAITQSARPQGGYQVRPSYPSSALRQGIQGTTMLKVHVLIDGRVGDVLVQQSAGHPDLDQAAIEAVRRWRFEPARRGSDPVAMWVLLPVQFQIR
jgi:periplasmic protein TonB